MPASAGTPARRGGAAQMAGTAFALSIGAMPVDITGRTRPAITVNNSLPAPTLRWREGDTVTVRVSNRLRDMTSIHWHGILLPSNMDGVPGLTQKPVKPGESFTYDFVCQDAGTFWYHPHLGTAEQVERGLAGVLVVEDDEPPAVGPDGRHVSITGTGQQSAAAEGDDQLVGTAGREAIFAEGGRDHLSGQGGDDLLVGGASLLQAFSGGTVWMGDQMFMSAAFCWANYTVLARRHGLAIACPYPERALVAGRERFYDAMEWLYSWNVSNCLQQG